MFWDNNATQTHLIQIERKKGEVSKIPRKDEVGKLCTPVTVKIRLWFVIAKRIWHPSQLRAWINVYSNKYDSTDKIDTFSDNYWLLNFSQRYIFRKPYKWIGKSASELIELVNIQEATWWWYLLVFMTLQRP